MSRQPRPYGVGLAYRPNLHFDIMQHAGEIDVLEVNSVDYIHRYWRLLQDPAGHLLREAAATFPCVAHGINMSIGSVEPHDERYLQNTKRFLQEYGIEEFSEHLAFHRMDGNDVGSFIAMPFEDVSLRWLEQKYKAARTALGRPFALENVSYLFNAPGGAYEEAGFLTELTRRTGCELLLDVTNVFNNATNHGYDPIEFIRRLPGDRITQLHIAGGKQVCGTWFDSHSAPVMEGVWELVHEALRQTAAEMIFLERDSNFYPFEGIMKDVRTARSIFYEHRPERAPETPAAAAGKSSSAGQSTAEQAAATEDAPGEPDPLDPEFANLRSYQRALMRQITDADFRAELEGNPDVVRETYPMEEDWLQRWQGCQGEHVDRMARKWPATVKRNRQMAEELPQLEWRAFALESSF